jgi:hypothetical protein
LGVLHGSYGAGPEAADRIPEALLEDYVRGLEEGSQGYEYGVAAPADRSGVLRRARAFADGKLGDINDGYEADHIDDKYNARKFADPAAWAARNSPDGAVYDPAQPDTRSQYSPQRSWGGPLWFQRRDGGGDRKASNAALAYHERSDAGVRRRQGRRVPRDARRRDEVDAEVDNAGAAVRRRRQTRSRDFAVLRGQLRRSERRMPWEDALPVEAAQRLFEVYPAARAAP